MSSQKKQTSDLTNATEETSAPPASVPEKFDSEHARLLSLWERNGNPGYLFVGGVAYRVLRDNDVVKFIPDSPQDLSSYGSSIIR